MKCELRTPSGVVTYVEAADAKQFAKFAYVGASKIIQISMKCEWSVPPDVVAYGKARSAKQFAKFAYFT
jgi:hypothetical protein